MDIGTRLKQLREAKGVDQVQAADAADTTKQAVSQIENGRTKVPGGIYLLRWAKYYGVDLEWLITGKGDPRPATGPSSQSERLAPSIIHRAVQLMREATEKVEGDAVDVESDPELFAEMLRLAILEPAEGRDDGKRGIRASGGQGGRTVSAESKAEDGPSPRVAGSRGRKRA